MKQCALLTFNCKDLSMNNPKPAWGRRTLMGGTAVTAAAVAGTAWLGRSAPESLAQKAAAPVAPPEKGGGYQVTEHVKHYYRTARI
jgi:hypothetical protein